MARDGFDYSASTGHSAPPPNAAGTRDLLDANEIIGEPRKGVKRFWTGREEGLLREHYPRHGLNGCLLALPGRSATSIYQHARILGLVGPGGRVGFAQARWTTSEAIDAVITRAYQAAPSRNGITRCAHAVGRPRWWVSRRAGQLGLVAPRFKEPPWSQEELAVVSDMADHSTGNIRKALKRRGFSRTETAIIVKLKRLRISRASNDPNLFTGRSLAMVMGVGEKAVIRWIEKGWLKAKAVGQARPDRACGAHWEIRRRDVRAFVIDNVAAVDLRKVDKFWFVDLLTGGDV